MKKIRMPNGYWNDKTIINELNSIIIKTNTFPTANRLLKMNRGDLRRAIINSGGFIKFRNILKYELIKKPNNYWNEEIIISELKLIIGQSKKFPTSEELFEINKGNLQDAIYQYGGINYFRQKMGYEIIQKPDGYWNEKNTIIELELLILKLGFFPNANTLKKMDRTDLSGAITKNGGYPKFRKLLKCDLVRNPNGYWNEEIIITELESITKELNHFPSIIELITLNKRGLVTAISQHGGISHFWKIFKIDVNENQKRHSETSAYNIKRGKNSEKIVKSIIQDWLEIHNLPKLSTNVKLAPKNVIEFVCDINKKIGVDVTNARTSGSITNKWRHKDYYKFLDKLLIVVFSNTFTNLDYNKWNNQSPSNVYIMTIDDFLQTLDYSTDEYLQNKIDKYNKCTFHSRPEKPNLSKFFKPQPTQPPNLNTITT